ncbi:MAG TPA: M23 family metallopeptidase [Mesotoga infera]|jgi:murein DD-endopeptidase MepM/ murein hydrolase activator NlpD|nr:M23 family metallopeptidase [Thermotogaceae bacterium]HNR78788.1 M23 family metallopeptidase [Mesotoga infera]HPD39254.1 M23 family metallopeptidase [Mesotoga infera]HRV02730.1 M23 family metallopeptidase [Mesotoga sp.]
MNRRVILIFLFVSLLLVTRSFAYFLVTYVVRSGDSIHTISRELGVSMSTIIDFNDLSDPNNIKAGDRLKLPQPDGLIYEVQSGDTIDGIAKLFFAPVKELLSANNLSSSSLINPGQRVFIPMSLINMYQYVPQSTPYRWPVYGVISSSYGWRTHPVNGGASFHSGLDIAAPQGTPIFAASKGVVIAAGVNGGYGNAVDIQHDNGYVTRYGHMSKICVYVGQRVDAGSLIGRVGSTGVSTGPHVHFEVKDPKMNTLDPLSMLPTRDLMYVIRREDDGTAAGGK